MGLMEFDEFFQRVIADNICVEDEDKAFFVVGLDELLCEFERSRCTCGLLLFGVGHFDLVLFLKLSEPSQVLAHLEVEVEDNLFDS